MSPFEIETALESFRIIADTREQSTPRASERFKSFGVPVERATLEFGDYCAQIDLPGGPLHDISKTLQPSCVIERKMSLDELASNFTRGRDRFRREFQRANKAGARVWLLVENGSFEAIRGKRYRSRYNSKAFQASLIAWAVRYGITPVFCKSGVSGELIREILYRDIKERLESGEYG